MEAYPRAPPAVRPVTRPAAPHPHPDPVRFAGTVRLTKREAFEACQALADADRFLLRAGEAGTADALGALFELLEERLTAPDLVRGTGPSGFRRIQASCGSNSSDRELTQ